MRYSSIVFLLSLLLVSEFAAAAPLTPRALDHVAAEAFLRVRQRSAIVRAIVREIEASNVIVHIETSRDLPMGLGGTTRFVAQRAGYRYVRITIAAGLGSTERLAILGHELHHAREIARSHAGDVATLRRLFETDGYATSRDGHFETVDARQVERRIRRELRDWQMMAGVVTLP